ncbi:uncharacterized protein GIQ15_00130 [Arthroderma uncinatum]|uniref:uncharacterized protein n=1 Tax=Arthroderma uncinatum TaxID=74035 RepID=UPI00144A7446|nr:uncharacterized protein GIQ15_00130 [Arthroderma uncinatum]KAF3490613.1 hypothetical protein GIQ15_00130 [Arthroderma uncinatum]
MDSGEGKGKAQIPKFGSFKPQPAPPQTDRESRDEKKSLRAAGDRVRTSKSSDLSRHHDSRRAKERSRESRASSSRHIQHDHAEDSSKPRSTPDASNLYILDATGDPYTLIYGSLHKYDIPRYYRFGAGRVLGLSTAYTIDQDLSSDTKIVITSRGATEDTAQRNLKALWRSASKSTKSRRLLPSSNGAPDLERDFLPLKEDGMSEEEKLPDYRSIEGKAKPGRDSDAETDIESDWSIQSEGEGPRLRNASLFRNVNEHPDNMEGWLRLINHQENMVGVADREGYRKFTSAEKRSIADIKVSLYEKALASLPHNAPRDRLLLGMIEEGSLIWDQKTLSNKWKSVLESNSSYISLWIKYLDFQQTTFTNFTYDKCRSVFLECLKVNARQPDSTEKQIISLYILLRLSLFMREAGFTEHSIGLWQALLEYNFCCPQGLNPETDRAAALSSFSEFWESEMPRIGEIGSQGWGKADGDTPDPKSDPDVPKIDAKDVFGSWCKLEHDLMSYSFLPARTLDEVQEDDPYRVVLFSDIADFLVRFSDPQVSNLVVDAFLIFCHLPKTTHEDSERIASWHVDPFFSNRNLDEADKRSPEWFSALTEKEGDPDQYVPFSFPYPMFGNDIDTLFGDGRNWFPAFQSWESTYLEGSNCAYVEWIRRSLKMLVSRMPDSDYLAAYTIAFEYSIDPKEAKKYAKQLLKSNPSNIKLYNAYALIEARNGQIATAEKVWTTTLSMSQSFATEATLDCITLWHTWVWEALNSQSYGKAIRLLLAIPNNNLDLTSLSTAGDWKAIASSAEFLKSKRCLDNIQAHGLTFRKPEMFSYSTDCLALLIYLTQGQEISAAIKIYDDAEQRLETQKLDKTMFLEPIHQVKSRLLYHHITENRVYKPAQIREELSRSVSLFPRNTIFLSLFAFNETRFRIENRVRSVLGRQLLEPHGSDDTADPLKQSTLIPHLFSIYSELYRGVSAGSTAHSARAAFEAAISSQSGQHTAALWKLYVQFELTLDEKEKARQVFFRSIRACPWSKRLVLLAYNEPHLRGSMSFDELRKVFNVLVEKELRVHVDLEEWLEDNEAEVMPADDGLGQRPPITMPDDKSSDEG